MILCLFLPYFTATALAHEEKVAAGTPLAVLRRTRVVANNAPGEREGALLGLTQRQAKAVHPEVTFLQEDEAALGRLVNKLLDTLSTFTPLVEYTEPHPKKRSKQVRLHDTRQSAIFYLDLERLNVAACERLIPQMQSTLRQTSGLEAIFGLASTKFVAFAACCCTPLAQVKTIPLGGEVAFLAPLSVNLLPADGETLRRFHLLGLKTLGQVGALPLSALLTQFGKPGFVFHRLVRGQDDLRVAPHRFPIVEQASCEFDTPLMSQAQIEAVLHSLATDLSTRLQAKGSMGRTFTLTLHLEDRQRLQAEQTLRQAVSGAVAISQKLLTLLSSLKTLPGGVVAIEVTVSQVVPFAGQQLELFIHQTDQRERLKQTLGNLTVRYNAECFLWIQPVERTARRIEKRYELRSAPNP